MSAKAPACDHLSLAPICAVHRSSFYVAHTSAHLGVQHNLQKWMHMPIHKSVTALSSLPRTEMQTRRRQGRCINEWTRVLGRSLFVAYRISLAKVNLPRPVDAGCEPGFCGEPVFQLRPYRIVIIFICFSGIAQGSFHQLLDDRDSAPSREQAPPLRRHTHTKTHTNGVFSGVISRMSRMVLCLILRATRLHFDAL